MTRNISLKEAPEVLVSQDEGAALLRYEELLRKKQTGATLLATAGSFDLPHGIEPLQIKEMELVTLNIPALSKWDSEDGTK